MNQPVVDLKNAIQKSKQELTNYNASSESELHQIVTVNITDVITQLGLRKQWKKTSKQHEGGQHV